LGDTAFFTPVLVGLLVGIATTSATVWLFNRWLAPFVEMPVKKPVALLALPSGIPVGVLAALRSAAAGPVEVALWLLLATVGLAITAWLLIIQMQKHLLKHTSRIRAVEGLPEPLDWLRFPRWQRVILWLLHPVNQIGALRIHKREVVLAGLSPAFDGYRIAHVTDLHAHPTLNREWYDAAIRHVMALEPDLVLFGGDFITQPEHLPLAGEILRPLSRAPDRVIAVRGNHDLWKAPRRSERLAAASGMRVLSNSHYVVERGDACLSIVGLEHPYIESGPQSESALTALPHPRVALVHTPDAFPLARRLGCQLALAGHTHGGQVRLPLLGATVTSCAAGPRRSTGVARDGKMLCITSNGLGVFFPLRFLCPPEIVLIVLRSPDSA